MFVSKRNIPLLWQKALSVPVITVENYEKWYSLYVIFPDGRAEEVPVEITSGCNDDAGANLWIDHCFHPQLLLLVARHYGGEAHSGALEMAAGRWVMHEYPLNVEMSYYLEEEGEEAQRPCDAGVMAVVQDLCQVTTPPVSGFSAKLLDVLNAASSTSVCVSTGGNKPQSEDIFISRQLDGIFFNVDEHPDGFYLHLVGLPGNQPQLDVVLFQNQEVTLDDQGLYQVKSDAGDVYCFASTMEVPITQKDIPTKAG